jgi:AmmeMemoRadiSam system protein B
VRRFLDEARPADLDIRVRILIVPHAGYVYSGPVAAAAYRLIEQMDDLDRIVMVGPSHYVWFPGLALPGAGALATPLGTVEVDMAAAAEMAVGSLVTEVPAAHEREHSLEVQLPFLQVVAPRVPVVPLLTGDVDPADVAHVVLPLLDEDTLLLVSSDLSHYHDAQTARRLDAETAAAIERLDEHAVTRESACGRTGIQAVIHVARRMGYGCRVLDLRNSSDTAGSPDRVVGYGAFAFGT